MKQSLSIITASEHPAIEFLLHSSLRASNAALPVHANSNFGPSNSNIERVLVEVGVGMRSVVEHTNLFPSRGTIQANVEVKT